MLELNQNLGIAGEFQVIVRRADGSVRIDTGMQKNLILDNGLKFYLTQKMTNDNAEEVGEERYGTMFSGLVVGSGNQKPTNTDIKLQSFIAHTSTQRDTEGGKTEPTKDQHPNFVKVWKRTKFIFDNIRNQNISELGLVTRYWDKTYSDRTPRTQKRYLLTTRALIKGNDGRPLTITVLEGEVLEVIYQINMYVDIRRQTGEFKLTTYPTGQNSETGVGTESQFEYFLQPHNIAQGQYIDYRLFLHDHYYNRVNSYGVKETDDKLNADYDLTQAGYQFDHTNTNWTEFNKLHSGVKTTGYENGNKYSESYQTAELVSTDVLTGKQTAKYKTGIYSHVHANGIRGVTFQLGHRSIPPLVTGVVIFKNKANGQGIKKTNRQIWEFLASWTIKRWEG